MRRKTREVCPWQHLLLLGANLGSLHLLSSLNTKAANLTQCWNLNTKVPVVTQESPFHNQRCDRLKFVVYFVM
jgi:hypothetical protein